MKKKLATFLTFFGFSVILWFLVRGVFFEKFIDSKSQISLISSGLTGDFIGGFVGTIFSLVGIILLYETLSLQRKEFVESKDVFVKQQFDNTYFELLNLYRENISNFKCFGYDGEKLSGKDFFEHQKKLMKFQFVTQRTISRNRQQAVNDFRKVYANHENVFSTYFRNLYRIYRLIDKSEISEKDKISYGKILRAQLSHSELFFIRYNAMTEQGTQSTEYINKYNILKHLSNFELLEFKDWWSKLDDFEINGLGTLFKEVKSVLKDFIIDSENEEIVKEFKNKKYKISLISNANNNFSIHIVKNNDIISNQIDIIDGFEKFTIEEVESLVKCILKEFIIYANFNTYNIRKEIDIYYEVFNDNHSYNINIGVRNIKNNPLKIHYWQKNST